MSEHDAIDFHAQAHEQNQPTHDHEHGSDIDQMFSDTVESEDVHFTEVEDHTNNQLSDDDHSDAHHDHHEQVLEDAENHEEKPKKPSIFKKWWFWVSAIPALGLGFIVFCWTQGVFSTGDAGVPTMQVQASTTPTAPPMTVAPTQSVAPVAPTAAGSETPSATSIAPAAQAAPTLAINAPPFAAMPAPTAASPAPSASNGSTAQPNSSPVPVPAAMQAPTSNETGRMDVLEKQVADIKKDLDAMKANQGRHEVHTVSHTPLAAYASSAKSATHQKKVAAKDKSEGSTKSMLEYRVASYSPGSAVITSARGDLVKYVTVGSSIGTAIVTKIDDQGLVVTNQGTIGHGE